MGRLKGYVKRCKHCETPLPKKHVQVCEPCKRKRYLEKVDSQRIERQAIARGEGKVIKKTPVFLHDELRETIAYQYLDKNGTPYIYGNQGRKKLEPVCQGCGATNKPGSRPVRWGPIFTIMVKRASLNVLFCLACYNRACQYYAQKQKAS
jgi:hypothetical protein